MITATDVPNKDHGTIWFWVETRVVGPVTLLVGSYETTVFSVARDAALFAFLTLKVASTCPFEPSVKVMAAMIRCCPLLTLDPMVSHGRPPKSSQGAAVSVVKTPAVLSKYQRTC